VVADHRPYFSPHSETDLVWAWGLIRITPKQALDIHARLTLNDLVRMTFARQSLPEGVLELESLKYETGTDPTNYSRSHDTCRQPSCRENLLWLFDYANMTHIYAKNSEPMARSKIQRAMSRSGYVREGCVPFMTFSKARLRKLFP
jgi:hypothetical protein